MPGAVDSLTDNRHNYARYTGCTTRSRTVGAQNIPKEHVTTAGSYQHNSHLHAVRMATERSRVMSSAAQCVAVFFHFLPQDEHAVHATSVPSGCVHSSKPSTSMRLRARALPLSKDSQLQEGEEIQMRPQLCRMLDLQVRHVLLPGPWRTPHRKRHHGSLSLKEIQEDGVSSLHDKKRKKEIRAGTHTGDVLPHAERAVLRRVVFGGGEKAGRSGKDRCHCHGLRRLSTYEALCISWARIGPKPAALLCPFSQLVVSFEARVRVGSLASSALKAMPWKFGGGTSPRASSEARNAPVPLGVQAGFILAGRTGAGDGARRPRLRFG